eukprot:TRINITY_DN96465_c0_g1_i1.p2 TRINITY_DN96465_c0_g1~~TRINITY_DN96465_c0_g1_i1.p2  ORF type:complete len:122 (+),score=13.28 TRINITY_DN96465_c0_g1_i1:722-1087(+)
MVLNTAVRAGACGLQCECWLWRCKLEEPTLVKEMRPMMMMMVMPLEFMLFYNLTMLSSGLGSDRLAGPQPSYHLLHSALEDWQRNITPPGRGSLQQHGRGLLWLSRRVGAMRRATRHVRRA